MKRARDCGSARLRLGHEVEDRSDRWAQPGSGTGVRDCLVSGCCEEGGGARRWLLHLATKWAALALGRS